MARCERPGCTNPVVTTMRFVDDDGEKRIIYVCRRDEKALFKAAAERKIPVVDMRELRHG